VPQDDFRVRLSQFPEAMARLPRFTLPDLPSHVTQRGNRRQAGKHRGVLLVPGLAGDQSERGTATQRIFAELTPVFSI